MSSNDMTFSQLVESLTPDTVGNLRRAVELGKWPDGRRLTDEQRATCMQAVLFWERKYLPETERTGYIDRGTKAEGETCSGDDHDHDHDHDDEQPLKIVQ